jgi:outer membrane protein assembly factor BamB
MEASLVEQRPAQRTFLRFWFPCVVTVVAALALTAIWTWPSESTERGLRGMGTVVTVQLSLLLLSIWLLFLSPLRWWQAIGTILLAVAVAFGAVREVKLTGDWVPLLVFRWDVSPRQTLGYGQPAASSEALDLRRLEATDYPEFRGRRRDGIVQGPPLARDWSETPPRLLWRQAAGGGYSSFALVGDVAVTLEQRDDHEAVVCYDAGTGKVRWLHEYPARFEEFQGGVGPRATPTIADGDVYSLGASGHLVCLDGATGKQKWAVEILDGNENIQWGMSGSPLVFDQVVVVNPGVQTPSAAGNALVAYDRKTGARVWGAGNTRAGYSSPMLATLAGRKQILLFDGEQIAGYDLAGGGVLWEHKWTTMRGINVAEPLVLDGDRVFISSGYGVGSAMLQVAEADGKFQVKELWGRNKPVLQSKFSNPVYRDGYIYGLDNGVLTCISAGDGTRKWKGERYGHGQLLLADDLLVIQAEESGELVLVQAKPDQPRELGRIKALTAKTRTWNHPALANGRAFVRNDLEMAAYDLRQR